MNLSIDKIEDRKPISCVITRENVINVVGEGGSGKSTFCSRYRNNDDYILVDYDLVISGKCDKETIEFYLRNAIIEKYGEKILKPTTLNETKNSFTVMYETIINLLIDSGKTIVLDGTQLRFINSVDKIRGEIIVLRPSIETCIQRSVKRKKETNSKLTEKVLLMYEYRRREVLYKLNPLLNELIKEISNKASFQEIDIEEKGKKFI